MTTDHPSNQTAGWLQPPEEQEGLSRYAETLRERVWLIVIAVLITTGISLLYVATATKIYNAEADLLITPVNGDDAVLTSLGLISSSADPTRDVETASRLITNIDVAERVRKQLGSPETAQDLLKKVSAEPVAQSNIVAVTAHETSPQSAQALANAFANQAVTERTARLHSQIDRQLPSLEAQAGNAPTTTTGTPSIDAQISELEVLRSGPDPTMRVETLAPLPTTQASPKPMLSVIGGIFAGLILGVAAAFAAQTLDPRLRREAQLRRRYRLPILGRIPKESHSGERPLSPDRVSTATSEAYRSLRGSLIGRTGNGGRVLLITGSSPSEGKTTTAVNLAVSLALAGKRVLLIESDLRRPVLGGVLGVTPDRGGIVSVLIENTTLGEALVQTPRYGPNLQLLLADYEGGWIADLFSIPQAQQMIEEARQMVDFVIIDSPPLNEVIDALPLVRQADDLIIVARLGLTRLDKLAQLAELLAENSITPAGFALVGTPRPRRGQSHYYAEAAGRTRDGMRSRITG